MESDRFLLLGMFSAHRICFLICEDEFRVDGPVVLTFCRVLGDAWISRKEVDVVGSHERIAGIIGVTEI